MRSKILIKREILEIDSPSDNAPYLITKLINQFGVIVDKPQMLSKTNLKTVSEFYDAIIPSGFYDNPQDMNYFTSDELLIEQLVSYFKIEANGTQSLDEDVFKRNEIFVKALPKYCVGDEIKIRQYKMMSKEEADNYLKKIADDFCKYTRPWSVDETAEFKWLYLNGFYCGQKLLCKDNAITLFLEYKNESFAKMLDKKDIVKMSVRKFGYQKRLSFSDEDTTIFALAIKNAKDCPMSLSQAKKYNAILKKIGISSVKEDNANSPYKKAIKLLREGDVLGSAKIFAENGSLLERNLVYLFSRADLKEANEIVDMIKADNPFVLIQLLLGLVNDDYSKSRVFRFFYNKRMKKHLETEKEHKFRKSILSIGMKKFLIEKLEQKVKDYYLGKESLGKIYLNEQFKKIALPLNTSAMGMGLDVLPTGSRLGINADYIRTFCYWHNAFDIDTSVLFIKENGEMIRSFWGNFSQKLFGKSALSSGDDRSSNGAEFYDFKISELKDLGFKYAIFALNGFNSTLNSGEIYCGYQNKKNLNTKAWDPKNIELKIHVKGESRAYIGFGLDFETNEVVILNQILDSNSRVVDEDIVKNIEIYLNKAYLDRFNMYKLLSYRGQVVNNKKEADFVFDSDYLPQNEQQVIRPYNIENLVNLLK